MAKDDTKPDMAASQRSVYGPRAIGTLVPGLTRPAFRRQGPASAQVIIDWPTIVGPALAAVTAPRRLSAGALTLACAGPIAMELQHMAVELINRINTHLGSKAVHTLRFVQVATLPIKGGRPGPSRRDLAAAEKAVADLPEGPLRDALARLGSAVLAGGKSSTPQRRRT
jgi:hypothetical protein